jgi:tetratricopeptide (TPR) repeat protein
MRIDRSSSRLSFRKRRRGGCISPTLLLGVLVGGLITMSWNWIGQWFNYGASPALVPADLQSAETAFNRGDLTRAAELAQQILAEDPDHTGALILLARALIYRSYSDYNRDGDRAAALTLISAAAARIPQSDDLQAAYAFVLQAAGDPVNAVEVARKVLERSPHHALARMAQSAIPAVRIIECAART